MLKADIIRRSVFVVLALVIVIVMYLCLITTPHLVESHFTQKFALAILPPEELESSILEEVPELRNALSKKNHLKITTLLREYVHSHIIWSNDGLNSEKYFNNNLSVLTASQISFLFNAKEIGVLCGGTAIYLAKIYELFGYQSAVYNYGLPGVSTHVITLVVIPNNGKNEVIVQDATFNSSLSIGKTGNLNFFDIIQILLEGKGNLITLLTSKTESQKIYFSDNADGRRFLNQYKSSAILYGDPVATSTLLTNTPILYAKGDLNFYSSYLRRNKKKILKAVSVELNKDMNECSVFELMLFPINLPSFNSDKFQSEVDKIGEKLFNRKK